MKILFYIIAAILLFFTARRYGFRSSAFWAWRR
jgi:hypothetical protein